MRAITVRQPWAWAIIHGGKDVENRSRNIAGPYRGPVAIHAGLTIDPLGGARILEASGKWSGRPQDYPDGRHPWIRGAIIGVVDLVDVHPSAIGDVWESACGGMDDLYRSHYCSPWAMRDHQHLVLANPRPLAEPIPYRGALGLWNLPDDVLAGAL